MRQDRPDLRRARRGCWNLCEARDVLIVLGLLVLWAGALRPAHGQVTASDAPEVCRIGVNIEDLYELDMARDTFGAVLWVWSLCPSAELTPLEMIAFPTASTGLNLGPVKAIDAGSDSHYAYRRVQGTFRFNWDMEHYPFDRQRLVIPIDETHYGAARLVFEPDTRESFLTPDIRDRLDEWKVSDLTLNTGISEEASTYGIPDAQGARYARIEAVVTLQRAQLVTFLKLTSGVFAGVFIAFLSFFFDPNDRGAFGGKLGLLVGVLFAVLLNLRAADTAIGDTGHLTLVTEIHLVTLLFIVVLALVALWDRRQVERGLPIRHPDWPMLAVVGSVYVLITVGLVVRAAWP
jgi:hypothetical protein